MQTTEMSIDRLSFEKVAYFPEHLNKLVAGEDAYPIHVQIGPVNFCNHDCTFCYAARTMFDAKKVDRDRMDVGRLMKIMREMQAFGLRAATLVGAGEPTLHPKIEQIIEGLGELGIEVAMFTNGSCITERTAKAIADHCTFVRFSLTGASPEVHDLVHANGDFHRVIENIRRVVAARTGTLPTLGSQFVLASYSARDLVEGAALAKSLGLDYFEIKPCYFAPGKPDQMENTLEYDQAAELMARAQQYEDENFRVYAKHEQAHTVFTHLDDREYDDCPGHRSTAVLEADLEMYICVNHKIPEFSFGNLRDLSFADVWHGDRRRDILRRLNVRECVPRCRQDPLNKIVHEIRMGTRVIPMNLPTPEPEDHVNFI